MERFEPWWGDFELAPGSAGLIADQTSLKTAFLLICVATWALCSLFFLVAARYAAKDIETLRSQMRRRAEQERLGLAPVGEEAGECLPNPAQD